MDFISMHACGFIPLVMMPRLAALAAAGAPLSDDFVELFTL